MADSAFELQVVHDDNKIDKTSITQGMPMPNDPTMVPSSADALTADTQVYNLTRNRAYIGGTLTYDVVPYFNEATTNSSGVATFNMPLDGSSNSLYPNLSATGMVAKAYGPDQYQELHPVVSSDKKTVTVQVNKLTFVLALLSNTTPATGIVVSLSFTGK